MSSPAQRSSQQPSPGRLIVVSAPSGGGKTSLVKALLAADKNLKVSVSHTTRSSRPGEIDGTNYHFVSVEDFNSLRSGGEFLEHAEVFGNFYGTAKSAVASNLSAGRDVILEIDWQGARQIKESFSGELLSIFILPPSKAELRTRLRGRGQDAEEVINARMAKAISEMSHYADYEFLVINDQFDTALADLQAILRGQRLRRRPQEARHGRLLESLLSE